MKNRIAVFANGWGDRNLTKTLEGMKVIANENNQDIFLFMSYDSWGDGFTELNGQKAIYGLPDLNGFDGAIIFSNIIYDEYIRKYVVDSAHNANIPIMSIGIELDGTDFVGIDNEQGMRELAKHMVETHHVKDCVFMGGPRQNDESNLRMKAVSDVLKENGLKLQEEDCFYGDWSHLWATDRVDELLKREKLPEVIFCANDQMAMSMMTRFYEKGIEYPEKIKLTGFDYIAKGQNFYPTLTTVEQSFYDVGLKGMEAFVKKINEGTKERFHILVPTHFRCGESCGCPRSKEGIAIKSEISVNDYLSFVEENVLVNAVSLIDNAIFKCEKAEDVETIGIEHFEKYHFFEGDNFYIVENSAFRQSLIDDSQPVVMKQPYRGKGKCIINLRDGKALKPEYIDFTDYFPGYTKDSETHIYIFQPLNIGTEVFGYYVMRDNTKRIADRSLYRYVNNLNSNLEKIRQNLKLGELNRQLSALYTRDSLTDLYNRFGYETYAFPYYDNNVKMGRQMIVMFADINRMKYINDEFGHLQGDHAIRTVAGIIKEEIPEDWIAIRYGGDEFLVVGTCNDEKRALMLCDGIEKHVAVQSKRQKLPYELEVSCGFILTQKENFSTLADYVKQADEVMYAKKEQFYLSKGIERRK